MLTSPPQNGCTPLFDAAQNNHLAVAEVLIKHGAKVDLSRDVSQCSFTVRYSITCLVYVHVSIVLVGVKNVYILILQNGTCNLSAVLFRFNPSFSIIFLSNASMQMQI